MEFVYGKYQIIDSEQKQELWRKSDKKYIVFIIAFLVVGVIIAGSKWLDQLTSKQEQFFFVIGCSAMLFFFLVQFVYNRKPFALTKEYLYLFPKRIVIKSDIEKEILIDNLSSIDFLYNGPDIGFYHPLWNPKRLRGNLNFLIIKQGQEEIKLELYLPKDIDKIWITKALINYRNLINKRKIK